jgi:hypothetical protein
VLSVYWRTWIQTGDGNVVVAAVACRQKQWPQGLKLVVHKHEQEPWRAEDSGGLGVPRNTNGVGQAAGE